MPHKKTHSDQVRLQHMCDAIREAMTFAKGKTLADLEKDRQLTLALIKEIEILGEAAGKVGANFRKKHPQIPWDLIVATRNRLIHGYFDVDTDIVWQTISEDFPSLLALLEKVLMSLRGA